ncbi:MAG: hypothetical protein M8357_09305 [Desulfobulbaceae bacterium]|nr:hypothetical protein [Desulfobulbaceae bacterium]
MCNNCKKKISFFCCLLLASLVLGSCAPNKKTVDAYRDPSDTRSAAQAPSSIPGPDVDQQKIQRDGPSALLPSRQQVSSTEEIKADAVLSLLTLVDDRIVEYEGKTAQWEKFTAEAATVNLDREQRDTITDCQIRLINILNGYNDLHRMLIRESSGQSVDASVIEKFVAAKRQDIRFLESDCQQIITADRQPGGWITGTLDRILVEKESELQEKMASGDYQQVIELYGSLPLEQGQQPAYQTTYNYGQALLRSGREEEAAEVFRELLASLQEQDLIQREFKLMQLIADIQFGMQNYEKAFERYVDIINRYAGLGENIEWVRKQQSMISARNSRGLEVRNFAELMRGYLAYNPERDAFKVSLQASRFLADFPDSSMVPTVNHIMYESRDRAEAWFAGLLQRIRMLKNEKNYQEALLAIEQLPMHEMPPDKKDLIRTLSDELTAADYEEAETRRLAQEEALQDTWSRGQDYLRAKEYDRAIEVFSTLADTSYADRANDKIAEASQLAAQEDRRVAAEYFVEAGKATDQEKRIDLLFKSRQLLQGILQKYPQSGLLDKTEKNLERIEEEIRSINPELLSEPDAGDRESMQQPMETTINGVPVRNRKEQVQTGYPQP